ncbi:MAG: cytochrome c-type biogenesis protein CcmH [Methylococcaceae bacterium]|nr:cytochrome c-type biogenesis protein CcmH [Methylococcaceae bacterium]
MSPRILILLLAALSLPVTATEIRDFAAPSRQAAYENLIKDLRCLVCQNQSLADSDADLAKDLRTEVYNIIQSGKNEDEAVKFLTDRYGDFVLYRPPVKPITYLLWLGPFAALLGGGLFLWRQARRRSVADDDDELSAEERQRLERLKAKIEG